MGRPLEQIVRRLEGDDLDLDGLVEHVVDRRAGITPTDRVTLAPRRPEGHMTDRPIFSEIDRITLSHLFKCRTSLSRSRQRNETIHDFVIH